MITGRRAEVQEFLRKAATWAERRPDVMALALVGSWARDEADMDSDVDLVALTEDPSAYTEHQDWVPELGGRDILRTQTWGAITERRFALPSGLEVEVGFGLPSWASIEPVEAGTREVVTNGFAILHDPTGMLAALGAAARPPNRTSPLA